LKRLKKLSSELLCAAAGGAASIAATNASDRKSGNRVTVSHP
jgi:hypothetical protein